jgi:hypothetical protein
MQVHSGKALGSSRLSRTGVELSREARVRLAWMNFYRAGQNVSRTCRHFGISRHTTAAQFLDTLQHRMPFPIRAVQVDGGSEFAAEFELASQQRGLHLFVLPPRSPKPLGYLTPQQFLRQIPSPRKE